MNLASVHQMLPNPINLTLTRQNPAVASIAVAECRARPLKQTELQRLGDLFGSDLTYRTFLLPAIGLGNITPSNGDWITDDQGIRWTVKLVNRELEGALYRLHCMQQSG